MSFELSFDVVEFKKANSQQGCAALPIRPSAGGPLYEPAPARGPLSLFGADAGQKEETKR